jgi:hypothetical protein
MIPFLSFLVVAQMKFHQKYAGICSTNLTFFVSSFLAHSLLAVTYQLVMINTSMIISN